MRLTLTDDDGVVTYDLDNLSNIVVVGAYDTLEGQRGFILSETQEAYFISHAAVLLLRTIDDVNVPCEEEGDN